MPNLVGYNFRYGIGNVTHKIRHILNQPSVQKKKKKIKKALYLLSFESDETTSSEMPVNFYQIAGHDIHRTVIVWYSCYMATSVTEGVFGNKFTSISKL